MGHEKRGHIIQGVVISLLYSFVRLHHPTRPTLTNSYLTHLLTYQLANLPACRYLPTYRLTHSTQVLLYLMSLFLSYPPLFAAFAVSHSSVYVGPAPPPTTPATHHTPTRHQPSHTNYSLTDL